MAIIYKDSSLLENLKASMEYPPAIDDIVPIAEPTLAVIEPTPAVIERPLERPPFATPTAWVQPTGKYLSKKVLAESMGMTIATYNSLLVSIKFLHWCV